MPEATHAALLGLGLVLASLHAQAQGKSPILLSCPPTLTTTQSVEGAVPAGWAAEVEPVSASGGGAAADLSRLSTAHRLASLQFTSGPLRERAFLAPENADAVAPRGRPVASRWVFWGPDTPHLVCQYQDTVVRLTQPVPAGYTRCEEVLDQATPGRVHTARCRP